MVIICTERTSYIRAAIFSFYFDCDPHSTMGRRRRSSPLTKKKTASGEFGNLRYAMSSMQGWRITMEDTHRVSLKLPGNLNDWAYAGLFDGHAGKTVASYASKNLLPKILSNINKIPSGVGNNGQPPDAEKQAQIVNAVTQGFLNLDQTMSKNKIKYDSGSTAVCVMISPTHLYIAHCGDSRAVHSRGRVHFATSDHKPLTRRENDRIRAAGGHVTCDNRVLGRLAMSRALGDFRYKSNKNMSQSEQMVIPTPDVTIIDRNDLEDEFVVLACDGVFDVMTNSELLTFIRNEMSKSKNLKTICNRVIDHCLKLESHDNMSIIIITLPGCPTKEELQRRKKSGLNQMNQTLRARKARKPVGNGKTAGHNTARAKRGHLMLGGGNRKTSGNTAGAGKRQSTLVSGNAVLDMNGTANNALSSKRNEEGLKNPFILYFLDYWKQHGGNVCEVAKHCGATWPTLSRSEKERYKRRFRYAKKKRNNQIAAIQRPRNISKH